MYTGATPVFADIDADTLALDPAQVDAKVTERTRAMIPVDVFGQPCPIEDLASIARRHDLAVIQDACEAIGAERNGVKVGSPEFADAAVFAFYPNKQMTTGEGGMIVTSHDDMDRVMRSLRNQGRDDAGTWMNHVRLGYNYRLDEMSAALGLSQVSRLDAILDGRDRVAAMYTERLKHVAGVKVPYIDPATTRMSWFVYVIQLEQGIDRARVMEKLMADGVPSRPYFVPIHLQPLYRERFGYKPGDFPVTERIAESTLAIPFFTDMTETQVDYVCERISARVGTA
jgi:perosamine synthetase